jgi:ATP-dependent Clp protease ATP-binding subunit ClpX
MAYDGVELEFQEDAIREIAREALKRNTGARGLRAIMEQCMLDVMYDIPNKGNVKKVIVTQGAVSKGERPILVTSGEAPATPSSAAESA